MPRQLLPQAVTSVNSACQVGVDLGPTSPIWGQNEAKAVLSSWLNLAGGAGPQKSKAPDTSPPTVAAHRQGFALLEPLVPQGTPLEECNRAGHAASLVL